MAAAMMSATKLRIQTCQVATNSQSAAATPSTWTIIGHGRRELTASSYVAQRWTVRRARGPRDAEAGAPARGRRVADGAPRAAAAAGGASAAQCARRREDRPLPLARHPAP